MSEELSGTESKQGTTDTKPRLVNLKGAKGLLPFKTLANYEVIDKIENGKPREYKVPLSGKAIWEKLNLIDPGYFKSLLGMPFVVRRSKIRQLRETSELFATLHLMEDLKLDWLEKNGCVTKAEFKYVIGESAEFFSDATNYPHYPPIKDTYYIENIPPKETGMFQKLLEFFNPATEIDRIAMKSAFVTLFWGGDSMGQKPAFVFDGEENEESTIEGKIGSGKSTVVEIMAKLLDESYVDLNPRLDIEEMKRRMLSSPGDRVVRFDNVKAAFVSSEAVENLVTARYVSGHKFLAGATVVPNRFVYCFTFNDASFSKDLSQRAVMIRLKKPAYDPSWYVRVSEFIDRHRVEIISDIGWLLTSDENRVERPANLRFPRWEEAVLNRCGLVDGEPIGGLIRASQQGMDNDEASREDLGMFLSDKISGYQIDNTIHINPDMAMVAIKSSVMTAWLREHFGKIGGGPKSLHKKLRLCCPGQLSEKAVLKNTDGIRFFAWNNSVGAVCHIIDKDDPRERTTHEKWKWSADKMSSKAPKEHDPAETSKSDAGQPYPI